VLRAVAYPSEVRRSRSTACPSRATHGANLPRLSFVIPPTAEFHTLSLHDALPIFAVAHDRVGPAPVLSGGEGAVLAGAAGGGGGDRKGTRLIAGVVEHLYGVRCVGKKAAGLARGYRHRPGRTRQVSLEEVDGPRLG